jgi:hypothetical protein
MKMLTLLRKDCALNAHCGFWLLAAAVVIAAGVILHTNHRVL